MYRLRRRRVRADTGCPNAPPMSQLLCVSALALALLARGIPMTDPATPLPDEFIDVRSPPPSSPPHDTHTCTPLPRSPASRGPRARWFGSSCFVRLIVFSFRLVLARTGATPTSSPSSQHVVTADRPADQRVSRVGCTWRVPCRAGRLPHVARRRRPGRSCSFAAARVAP